MTLEATFCSSLVGCKLEDVVDMILIRRRPLMVASEKVKEVFGCDEARCCCQIENRGLEYW